MPLNWAQCVTVRAHAVNAKWYWFLENYFTPISIGFPFLWQTSFFTLCQGTERKTKRSFVCSEHQMIQNEIMRIMKSTTEHTSTNWMYVHTILCVCFDWNMKELLRIFLSLWDRIANCISARKSFCIVCTKIDLSDCCAAPIEYCQYCASRHCIVLYWIIDMSPMLLPPWNNSYFHLFMHWLW